ncbi:MAG: SPASM domain-containing protein [Acidobacteria bacterium]|nr:SPASM domain-containing protein [Acidobacteriota bacterium]
MRASIEGRPELLVFELAGLERYGGRTLSMEEIVCVLDEARELGVRRVTLEVAGAMRTDDLTGLAASAAKRIPSVTVSFERGCIPDSRIAPELADAGVDDVAVPYALVSDGAGDALEAIDALRDEGLGVRAVLAGWPGLADISAIARRVAMRGVTRLQVDVVCGSTRCPVTSAMLARMASDVVEVARSGTLAVIVNELPLVRRIDIEARRAVPAGGPLIPRAPIELNDSRTTMRIAPTGDVTPSRAMPLVAGNVRRQRLDGIWSVPGLYTRLRDRTRLVGRCRDCAWRELCGGSRARAWHAEGDYSAADPACALPVAPASTLHAATA